MSPDTCGGARFSADIEFARIIMAFFKYMAINRFGKQWKLVAVLILDNPAHGLLQNSTSGLDGTTRVRLRNYISHIHSNRRGRTGSFYLNNV